MFSNEKETDHICVNYRSKGMFDFEIFQMKNIIMNTVKSVDLMIVFILMNVHLSSPCFSLVNFLNCLNHNAYEITIFFAI